MNVEGELSVFPDLEHQLVATEVELEELATRNKPPRARAGRNHRVTGDTVFNVEASEAVAELRS